MYGRLAINICKEVKRVGRSKNSYLTMAQERATNDVLSTKQSFTKEALRAFATPIEGCK
jgi:hypothetical protein